VLHVSRARGNLAAKAALRRFVDEHGITVLNVAGPRTSKEPEVGPFVTEILGLALLDNESE
jgi:hypothetical protein